MSEVETLNEAVAALQAAQADSIAVTDQLIATIGTLADSVQTLTKQLHDAIASSNTNGDLIADAQKVADGLAAETNKARAALADIAASAPPAPAPAGAPAPAQDAPPAA